MARPAFLTDVRTWIILALLAWIIVGEFTRKPGEAPEVQIIRDTIEIKSKEDVRLGEIIEDLKAENEQLKNQSKRKAMVFENKIADLSKDLAGAREKIAVMIDTIPDLQAYVAASDTVQVFLHHRIEELQGELHMRETMSTKLGYYYEAQLRIREQIIGHKDEIIASHEKTIKKQSRLIKWLKVGLPVALVGGFLAAK